MVYPENVKLMKEIGEKMKLINCILTSLLIGLLYRRDG